jgi:hypothetical protein
MSRKFLEWLAEDAAVGTQPPATDEQYIKAIAKIHPLLKEALSVVESLNGSAAEIDSIAAKLDEALLELEALADGKGGLPKVEMAVMESVRRNTFSMDEIGSLIEAQPLLREHQYDTAVAAIRKIVRIEGTR